MVAISDCTQLRACTSASQVVLYLIARSGEVMKTVWFLVWPSVLHVREGGESLSGQGHYTAGDHLTTILV